MKGHEGIPSTKATSIGAPTAQYMAFIRSLLKEQRRPDALMIPLSKLETVVFDLETTGFSSQHGDGILSFGAVKMVGADIIEEERFYSLVDCRRQVPQHITELTGITQGMTDGAPPLMNGLHDFMSFVGGRVLIAHASAHDKAFLNAALWKTSKTHLRHRIIDTMMIARWLEPQRDGYGLDELLMERNIPIIGRHHALEDALMTAKLWKSYLTDISKRRVDTLSDLYAYLSRS
ncbi:exonuclease domain-containing protein [Paenibacillus sp. FA6]|uniref:exonuclease domain-containing protein n=1 Tax=Paenibacillus sp. FA6 TaxID=3413029 RepID=UPI003F65A68C